MRFLIGFAGAAFEEYGWLKSCDGMLTTNPTNPDISVLATTNTSFVIQDDVYGGQVDLPFTLNVINTKPDFTVSDVVE